MLKVANAERVDKTGETMRSSANCITFLLIGLLGPSLPANGAGDTSHGNEVCDLAAQQASQKNDVPLEVLMAISRVETGRQSNGVVLPWPWTINQAGKGHWFEDSAQAIAFANLQIEHGLENFDVGCFQINLHWHGGNFVAIEDAFDPIHNAAYAARFLSELRQSEGSWSKAVAAYHSRSPNLAQAYLAKVESALVELRRHQAVLPSHDEQLAFMASDPIARPNRFPLLQTGSRGNGASLVPFLTGGLPLFAAGP